MSLAIVSDFCLKTAAARDLMGFFCCHWVVKLNSEHMAEDVLKCCNSQGCCDTTTHLQGTVLKAIGMQRMVSDKA